MDLGQEHFMTGNTADGEIAVSQIIAIITQASANGDTVYRDVAAGYLPAWTITPIAIKLRTILALIVNQRRS